MSSPVIIQNFTTPGGQPFSLVALDDNFAAIVAAVNELSTTPLLQLGATPGVFSGYLPLTGGSLAGQISAPSMLIGPPGGPFDAVIHAANLATTAAAGLVKKMAAVADLATAISNPPTQAEVTEIRDKINALLAAARTALQLTP
jgi:hypothetical protein